MIQVGDQKLDQMGDAEPIQAGPRRGVRLTHNGRPLTITFATTGDLSMRCD